jgi:uncharacterized phage infection (PIP) family protein YhgE
VRVCDACYNLANYHSQAKQVEEMLNPQPNKKKSESEILSPHTTSQEKVSAAREQLFEGTVEKPQSKTDDVRSTTASTMSAMEEAREEMLKRGKNLQRLDDKSAKLAEASNEFANMAKQLRERQEKQSLSSWWS